MSSARDLTLFELVQFASVETRKAMEAAFAERGYPDLTAADARLIWESSTGKHNVQQLADRMGTTKQYCAREVAKLRDAGFLATQSDADDKRAVRVELTESGRELLVELRAEKLRLEDEMRARIGDSAYETTRAALGTLLERGK